MIEVFYIRDASLHADLSMNDCDSNGLYWFSDENGDGTNVGCYELEAGTTNSGAGGVDQAPGAIQTTPSDVNNDGIYQLEIDQFDLLNHDYDGT